MARPGHLLLIGAAFFLLLGPTMAVAQDISISLGEDGSITARSIQLILLITVLSLAPGLAIMITCFPFIVTVLSILSFIKRKLHYKIYKFKC